VTHYPWETASVDLHQALQARRMCRSFSPEAVDHAVLESILRAALRSPTAGNTAGTAWVVLNGSDQTSAYWEATTDAEWRAANPEWAAGLMRAPVVLLSYASAHAYLARYSEADKATSALGSSETAWPVPYWFGDAAFGVMAVLLCAVDAGLGACVLGNFRGEAALASSLGVPDEWRLFGAVALGTPAGDEHRSRSLDRGVPSARDRIHRGGW
jgi:nitroreductase